MKKTIIITGGMGYIGSHVWVELMDHYEVVIIDNLINSKINTRTSFYHVDLLNKVDIDRIFNYHKPYAVLHLAGLKSVNQSVTNPCLYYQNNLISTLNLLEVMDHHQCYNLIFSSSATVYGNQTVPFTEDMPIGMNITNPYGQTKFMIEQILKDMCISNNKWHIIILRYFNPIGAHKSGLIGEDPLGIPNNLMPIILQSITNSTVVKIFGTNYDTIDGTCVRDYIHVIDIAKAHFQSLKKIDMLPGYHCYNLGTGKGTSVLQLISIFEKVNNVLINIEICDRRKGDLPIMFCNIDKAKDELEWEAELSIDDMCLDSWNFYKHH